MSYPPFRSAHELQTFVLASEPEQFKNALPYFSFDELARSFFVLQTNSVATASTKKFDLFQFIHSPPLLEDFGKCLSPEYFQALLNFLNEHVDYQNRLSPILVGLPPKSFSQALNSLKEEHFGLLQHESLFEPLQYQLMQFVHEGEELKQHIENAVQQLKLSFQGMRADELTPEGLGMLLQNIENLKKPLLVYLDHINNALILVWHTDRIDLIEKLSSLKEALQHQLYQTIGQPASEDYPSSGLYMQLEQHLAPIFDATLVDQDAAIEGLTRLSIWYLEDYWELGLLPSIHQEKDLDLDVQRSSEEERLAYKQHLFSLVQQELDRLRIGTVGDLKRAYLFSKPLLRNYILRGRLQTPLG